MSIKATRKSQGVCAQAVAAIILLIIGASAPLHGATVTIGTGAINWTFPMYTFWHDTRTQTIYLASEIGSGGSISALALDVSTIPGQVMNNWTIRMKHTALNTYGAASFDAAGWTIVYQGNEPRGVTGWRTFTFATPFVYNGTSNLMIDFSYNNTSYTSSGNCRASAPGGARSVTAYTDSGFGDPLTWSGATANPVTSINIPNIQLTVLGGEIRGSVWNDLNTNGVLQPASEPGIEGRTVYLDTNNNGVLNIGEPSQITGVGGSYTFSLSVPATYYVRQVLPVNWTQTFPGGGAAHVLAFTGTDFSNINFGAYSATESQAPGTPDLAAASDVGISNNDNLTNLNNTGGNTLSFTVNGTIASAVVTLYASGTPIGSAPASGFTTTVTTNGTATLPEGLSNITARQTEPGKLASPNSAALALTVDTVPPALPPAPDLQAGSDLGVSNTDDITRDNTPTFDIAAPPSYRFLIDGIQSGGSYLTAATFTVPVQADGTYGYSVVAMDNAGNEAASAVLSVTIATALPPAPPKPVLQAASDSGISGSDGITNVNTPTFDIAAAPYFRLYRFGTLVSGSYETGTAYTAPLQPDGAYSYGYNVTTVDTAGNESAPSAGLSVTIDTVPPAPSPGQLDTSFGGGRVITAIAGAARATAVAIQSDGKIVAAGSAHNGLNWDFAVARYTPDGLLDASFGIDGTVTIPLGFEDDECYAMVLQPDDKIVLAGSSTDAGGYNDAAVVRLNADGSLDNSFGDAGRVIFAWGTSDDLARALVLQPDGKVVVGGTYFSAIQNYDFALARLNPDGSLDPAFGAGGKTTTALSTVADGIYALALQSDGKIVAAGDSYLFSPVFGVARYNTDGSLDAGFGFGGRVTVDVGNRTRPAAARAVTVRSNGTIILAGYAPATVNGTPRDDVALAFLGSTGSVGSTLLTAPSAFNDLGTAMALDANGKVLVAGRSGYGGVGNEFLLTRFNGIALDTSFGTNGAVSVGLPSGSQLGAQALVVQADGKVVLAGDAGGKFALVRLYPNAVVGVDAIDLQAGSDSGLSNNDNLTSVTSPVFDVISSAPYFRVYGDGVLISGGYETGATFAATAQTEGTHAYAITCADVAGNESALSAAVNVTIDATPPSAPVADGVTPIDNVSPTWTWAASGGGNGSFRYELDGTSGVWTPTTGTAFTPSFGLQDGPHTLYVQESDEVGNWSVSGSFAITVDTIAAAAPLVSGVLNVSTTKPTWTWVGGGGGNGAFRYQVDGTAGAWTPTTATSFTSGTALADGAHSIYVQEQDAFGRWSVPGSFTTAIDTFPPNKPSVSSSVTLTSSGTPTWTWASGGGGSGTFRYGGATGSFTETTATSFTPATPLLSGVSTLFVQERDGSGNWSVSGSFAITIDRTPPAAPIVSGITPSPDPMPLWSWTSGSGGIGIFRYELDRTPGLWIETAELSFAPSINLSPGDYTLSVQERDAVGNWSPSGTFTILIDAVPQVVVNASSPAGAAPLSVPFIGMGLDSDGDALTYLWDFGDGNTSTEQNPTHVYSTAGTYTATLSVFDGKNGVGTSSVIITVSTGGGVLPAESDADGDGFSNDVEIALNSSASNADSRPMGLALIEQTGRLSVSKMGIKLSFAKPSSDSISLSGVLLIQDGFVPLGKKIIVDIGGVVRGFELNAKGGAKLSNQSIAIGIKSQKGRTPLQVAKFAVKLSKGSFAANLKDDGLVNSTASTKVTVPVSVIFDGVLLQNNVLQAYKASAGKSGAAK